MRQKRDVAHILPKWPRDEMRQICDGLDELIRLCTSLITMGLVFSQMAPLRGNYGRPMPSEWS
jgi:hypothetical protein